MKPAAHCPCGTERRYDACCGRFHCGTAEPDTAVELMRSRYAAFVAGEASYLLRTWHPATRPERIDLDDGVRWTGLEVLGAEAGGPDDRRGTVEFRAHHVAAGIEGSLHELSRFRRDNGTWRYVRGRARWS